MNRVKLPIIITGYLLLLLIGLAISANSGVVAKTYLSLWQSGDYSAMYDLLSSRSKQYISRSEFISEQRDFADNYIIESYSITETTDLGETVIIRYELTLTGIGRPSKYQTGKLKLIRINNRWYVEH